MTLTSFPGGRRPFRDYRCMRCPHCGKVSDKEDWMLFLSGGGVQMIDLVDPRGFALREHLHCPRCSGPLDTKTLLEGGYDIFRLGIVGWVSFLLSGLYWLALLDMAVIPAALLAGLTTACLIGLLRLAERVYFRALKPGVRTGRHRGG